MKETTEGGPEWGGGERTGAKMGGGGLRGSLCLSTKLDKYCVQKFCGSFWIVRPSGVNLPKPNQTTSPSRFQVEGPRWKLFSKSNVFRRLILGAQRSLPRVSTRSLLNHNAEMNFCRERYRGMDGEMWAPAIHGSSWLDCLTGPFVSRPAEDKGARRGTGRG